MSSWEPPKPPEGEGQPPQGQPPQYGQQPPYGQFPQAPPAYGYGAVPAQQGWNGLAIAGFVLAFLCSIVGIILSAIALNQINKSGQRGRGLAIAGIIIGAVSIIISIIYYSTK